MANRKVLKLSEKYATYLEELPEQGMGYQLVDIKLKDGRVLLSRVVLNCIFLKLKDDEDIKNDDIMDLKICDDY
ncbi:hypothetical protein [Allomuricauda sp. M10]|uniref:hypothetical protein n=1 Tax=Allomuricauda sp. M10 TaxID=2683292 RepID=UPI001D1980D1|nr:hypothetical protein [Muricauda sp. M10]